MTESQNIIIDNYMKVHSKLQIIHCLYYTCIIGSSTSQIDEDDKHLHLSQNIIGDSNAAKYHNELSDQKPSCQRLMSPSSFSVSVSYEIENTKPFQNDGQELATHKVAKPFWFIIMSKLREKNLVTTKVLLHTHTHKIS